ncbi:MAG: lipid A biosynthesis acyltransferase [Pseudomonadota bacterium]
MAHWLSQPERGSKFLVRFIAWVGLRLGRPVGRLLLYPIAGYFLLTGRAARNSSRAYLETLLGESVGLGQTFQHVLVFSQVTLDRIFFLTGQLGRFDIKVKGRRTIDELIEKREGCLLLGAHMGSFEALRALGTFKRQLPIKILMYPQNSERILEVLRTLNPEMASQVIQLGQTNTMIWAKQHVEEGGLLGLLGDRRVAGDKTFTVPFLGQETDLPAGPFLLASALKVQVIFFVCLYKGGNRYEIHLERLGDGVSPDRQNREADLKKSVERYAQRLEAFCRESPYNWFNFFDFWDQNPRRSDDRP